MGGLSYPGNLLHSIHLIDCQSGNRIRGADVLRGKLVALAIGPCWLPEPLARIIGSCSRYLDEIKETGKPIEFVYVAVDRDEKDVECFNSVIEELRSGWLAVPFEDTETRSALLPMRTEKFCGFVFVGENGETITTNGLKLMRRWGAQGLPYSSERIAELEKLEVERRASQTLKSVLVTPNRDFVIKNDGTRVNVQSFRGKVVGLFFTAHWVWPCRRFSQQLIEVYHRLQGKLEVVMVSHDPDEASFVEQHKQMPWLAVPYSDTKHRRQLNTWFNVKFLPALVFLDEHGQTIGPDNAFGLVYKYGADGFPFTPARVAELQDIEDRKRAEQSIETLLIRNNRDYLLGPGGEKVNVSELLGKTVGLYFSAQWSDPSRRFARVLASVCKELKREGKEFEVVFISCDQDEAEWMNKDHSLMHGQWLAVPFLDRPTKCQLSDYFGVKSIPKLVIIGPDGKTVTTDGTSVLSKYRAPGFPYTEKHLRGIDELEESKRLPVQVPVEVPGQVEVLGHTLQLEVNPARLIKVERGSCYMDIVNEPFTCDACGMEGFKRVYLCTACERDFHPDCVIQASSANGGKMKPCLKT